MRKDNNDNRFSKTETISSSSDPASDLSYDFLAGSELRIKMDKKFPMRVSLADFPKGPIPGELLHEIFENIDFQAEPGRIKDIIELKLVQYGFDPLKWMNSLVKAFDEILGTSLYNGYKGQAGQQTIFSLKDIKKDKRLNEMEFIFPFKAFSRQMLADTFRQYMKHPASSLYAQKILELEFNAFKGFMKGFVDLVFQFKGKWYIVDYKSNFLGDVYSDYSLTAMTNAMVEHHYFLQYHLYVTALHRYLGLRLRNYNYNSHFAGVLYLFIRGMHPESGPEFGVFQDKPNYELIKQLSALF